MKINGKLLKKQFDKLYKNDPSKFYFSFHACSICGYNCAYYIANNQLVYDNGCDCLRCPPRLTISSWDDIADIYNMQKHPESSIKKQIENLFELNKSDKNE